MTAGPPADDATHPAEPPHPDPDPTAADRGPAPAGRDATPATPGRDAGPGRDEDPGRGRDAAGAHRAPAGDDGDPGDGPRFGTPGRPLDRRNPFVVGLLGGLGVLVAYGTFLGLRNAASILVLVFVAMFLAIGLNPAVVRLTGWGLRRGAAVAVVALGALALLVAALYALVPPLVTQSAQLVENVPGYVQSLQRNETVREFVQRYGLLERVQGAMNANTVTNALGGVVGGARLLFGTIFNVLTVVVLTVYFMAAFERIKRGGYRLVPRSRRERVELLGDEILAKVGAYMVGALAIAVLAGVSTFVFGLVVGLAYPFALAVVVALCDLVPQIGATLGAVVVSLVGLASSLTTGLACAVFFLIYQQVENYLIYPTVMRRSVAVSDVAAVVAALLGVALFGVIGALAAIPMVAAVQLIGREVVLPAAERR